VLQCVAVCCLDIIAVSHLPLYKEALQPIPLGVTFSNVVSKLKAQSWNVSFH